MNKQEVIEKIKNLNARETFMSEIIWVKRDDVLDIIKQLDEPEKPVVPQFVADWLEVCKENLALSLASSMNNIVMRTNNQPDKTIHWLAKNSETFAKAWLFGYEVEKEELYTVKFSNEDFGKTYIGIIKTANKIGISTVPINDECSKCYFTKSELEEFKFWNNPAFEIKEVTE